MRKHSLVITEADRTLFRTAVASLRPASADESTTLPNVSDVPLPVEFSDDWTLPMVESTTLLRFARPGIQTKLQQQLQRGHLVRAASLDLHGQTINKARQLLSDFLNGAIQRQHRCIIVIHGKSRRTVTPPLLKNRVNGWLRQHPAVLAFCSALPHEGGTGAVYILLKTAYHKHDDITG